MKRTLSLLISYMLLSSPFLAQADIVLPHFFSDNMVLQRDTDVPIWGTADRKEAVALIFQGKTYTTQADKEGKWQIVLPPTSAGGPHSITISGKNNITLNNILFGDVYLASGQSNMEWSVSKLHEAYKVAGEAKQYPNIRYFSVSKSRAFSPQTQVAKKNWQIADSTQVLKFSAVAYFFARELYEKNEIPIGLIGAYWGGTSIEAWMSKEALSEFPKHKARVEALGRYRQTPQELEENYDQEMQKWADRSEKHDPGYAELWYSPNYNDKNWKSMYMPSTWERSGLPDYDGSVWFRKSFSLPDHMIGKDLTLHLKGIHNFETVWINGKQIGSGEGGWSRTHSIPRAYLKSGNNQITIRILDSGNQGGMQSNKEEFYISDQQHQFFLDGDWRYQSGINIHDLAAKPAPVFTGDTPMTQFNGMIAPLIPYALKGILWYQGERNASRAYEYRSLFPAMIQDWRSRWKAPDLAFLFVQLANYRQADSIPQESEWAELREAQAMTLSLPHTAMATAIDLGEADNIHPNNKKEVGRRLALAARATIYNEKLIHQGPVFDSMEFLGNQIAITFETQGSPLVVKDKYGYVKGFSIAREDRQFKAAKAYILNEKTVIVYHDKMINPAAVRYGWADNPDDLNLYNEVGLPALPFRTDQWPVSTDEAAE